MLCVITTASSQSDVKLGFSLMPNQNIAIPIGYDKMTNIIWFVGGKPLTKSLISFNVSLWNQSNAFMDHGSILSYGVMSYGQSFTQIQNNIYVIGAQSTDLMSFDLPAGYLNPGDLNPNSTVNLQGCLASIDDLII